MSVTFMPVRLDGETYHWLEKAETDGVAMNLANGNAYHLMEVLGLGTDDEDEFSLRVPLNEFTDVLLAVATQRNPVVERYKDRLSCLILWAYRYGATHISIG